MVLTGGAATAVKRNILSQFSSALARRTQRTTRYSVVCKSEVHSTSTGVALLVGAQETELLTRTVVTWVQHWIRKRSKKVSKVYLIKLHVCNNRNC